MKLSHRLMIVALIACFIYLFAFQIQAIWPFTIDDMYIPLRYARHWADGYGLVWNIGELPVEGYSNFSFVLLGRIALMMGLNPVLVLKISGVVGLALTCVATYQLSRFWFLARIAVIPCLWLLAYQGQILWSVSGLETTLYQALIVFSLVYIFKGLGYSSFPERQSNPRPVCLMFAGILLALAGMTRPEAPALIGLFVCLLWFHYPRACSQRGWVMFFAPILLCFAPWFLWRWHYYGRFFPNPIYCKGLTGSWNLVLDKQYLALIWPFFIVALPAIWKNKDRRHLFLWLPSLVYCVLLMRSSPVVAFDNRLFLPAFALMLPLSLQGINFLLFQWLKSRDDVMDAAVYLVAGLLLFFFIPMMSLEGYRHFTQNPLAGERLRADVLAWLDKNTTPQSRVVLADSGLIPYQSRLKFTDSYCLNNVEMTQNKSAGMYARLCKQVLIEKPDVIILTSLIEHGHVTYTPADSCLAQRLKSSKDYRLQANLSTGDLHTFYRYEIYRYS